MVPSEPEIIHLTPWDLALIMVDHIQKGILLPKPGIGCAKLIDDLASSLASSLGCFYPLAGRLTASEITVGVSSPSLAISLCCNGEGAEFIHAVAPEVTVSHITTPLYIPSVVRSFPLYRLLNVEAVVSSLPVLAAQVTELADGIFIAMSLSHGVADGATFWLFFNTWSEINRRSSGGGEGYKLSTLPPVLDRWFLDTCPVPVPLEDIVRRPEYMPVKECFFHFSAESIKRLKTKANAEMAETATATISSLQSLLAHIWRAVCRARGLAPHLETTYKLAIGCRAQVKSIPQEYMGNAVVLDVAISTVSDLLDKGLGWAAWLLNNLTCWAQKPNLLYAKPSRNHAHTVTGSSSRFDVYSNDVYSNDKVDGKVTVFEGRAGGGSMALEVCLSPEPLGRLIADEEFMEAVSAV